MSSAEAALGGSDLRWHLKVGDERHGPYRRAEIARYLGEGRVSAHSLLAREGSEDWHSACEDPELKDLFNSEIPPPPHTTPTRQDAGFGGESQKEDRGPAGSAKGVAPGDSLWAHIAYGIFASVLVVFSAPLLIVGVILAHINRDQARGSWLESHYHWQIRTFWIALPVFLVGSLTWIFLIGWLFLFGAWAWTVYRAIKGWLILAKEKPIEDPLAFF